MSSSSPITLDEIIDFNDQLVQDHPEVSNTVSPPGLDKSSFLHALALEGGVFTTMRTTFNGTRILSLDRHIKRLSAAYDDTNDVAPDIDTLGRAVKKMCIEGICALNGEAQSDSFEAQVTIGITYRVKDMWMFLCPLPVHKNIRCVAELIRGERNGDVRVKDVSWTEKRKSIGGGIPQGVEELVMVGRDDRVTEGLSSNVAIVVDGKVYTAGADKVLSGTIRELLLEACRDHDVEVVYEAMPVEMARRADAEMLIMSTSRLVLSVERLIIPGEFNENGEVVVVEHPIESQLVSSLKSWVKGKVEVDSFPLDDYESINQPTSTGAGLTNQPVSSALLPAARRNRGGVSRDREEASGGYHPRRGADLDDLVGRWKEHLHPRAIDMFKSDEKVAEILRLIGGNIDKNSDPVLGGSDCVYWYGEASRDVGSVEQAVIRFVKPGEEHQTETFVNRLLAFMFANTKSFERLLQLPKVAFKMVTRLRHAVEKEKAARALIQRQVDDQSLEREFWIQEKAEETAKIKQQLTRALHEKDEVVSKLKDLERDYAELWSTARDLEKKNAALAELLKTSIPSNTKSLSLSTAMPGGLLQALSSDLPQSTSNENSNALRASAPGKVLSVSGRILAPPRGEWDLTPHASSASSASSDLKFRKSLHAGHGMTEGGPLLAHTSLSKLKAAPVTAGSTNRIRFFHSLRASSEHYSPAVTFLRQKVIVLTTGFCTGMRFTDLFNTVLNIGYSRLGNVAGTNAHMLQVTRVNPAGRRLHRCPAKMSPVGGRLSADTAAALIRQARGQLRDQAALRRSEKENPFRESRSLADVRRLQSSPILLEGDAVLQEGEIGEDDDADAQLGRRKEATAGTFELCAEEYEDMDMLFGRSCSSGDRRPSGGSSAMRLSVGSHISKSPIRPSASRVQRHVIPADERQTFDTLLTAASPPMSGTSPCSDLNVGSMGSSRLSTPTLGKKLVRPMAPGLGSSPPAYSGLPVSSSKKRYGRSSRPKRSDRMNVQVPLPSRRGAMVYPSPARPTGRLKSGTVCPKPSPEGVGKKNLGSEVLSEARMDCYAPPVSVKHV
ncbi:hypothetical protein FOL47_004547 [Perkinsus chesapeaki]|uniref:Uncharacterized protein n=1 Tax=Perkinsus chesapeaki TaxID=330153 RepID=A0A7J6M1Q9_PERCH|nr:hypothetical protein FOL47_004547 [Perkinsus chesapeaki]